METRRWITSFIFNYVALPGLSKPSLHLPACSAESRQSIT